MTPATRKKQFLKNLPDLMKGCLSLTSRSCGKPECSTCQRGEKHPMCIFTFSVKGKKKRTTIPPKLRKQVQKLLNNYYHYRDLIEELTDVNIQLIKKGEFKE